MCSKEKMFWKHAANLQENTHAKCDFNKVAKAVFHKIYLVRSWILCLTCWLAEFHWLLSSIILIKVEQDLQTIWFHFAKI